MKDNMNEKSQFTIKGVKKNVQRAISAYCKDEGITQARYLEKDKRIKGYL